MKEIISHGHLRCKELSPHKNRGMEITYVERGMLEWIVEGVPEKVGAGSVFFTLPWQVHGSLNSKEPDNVIWHVLFHLEEDYPQPVSHFGFPACFGLGAEETRMLSAAFAGSSTHAFAATASLRWLLPALVQELQSEHELGETHVISLLRGVLVELKRVVSGETTVQGVRSWSEGRVQSLLSELSAHCDRHWTLAEMAESCGIKRTRLTTLFQQITGSTPMGYLAHLRMERAKTLLRETELKVIDVAFECGFSSSQYFANTFKQVSGMTPSAYRSQCAGLTAEELQRWSRIGFRSEQEERQRIEEFSTN